MTDTFRLDISMDCELDYFGMDSGDLAEFVIRTISELNYVKNVSLTSEYEGDHF